MNTQDLQNNDHLFFLSDQDIICGDNLQWSLSNMADLDDYYQQLLASAEVMHINHYKEGQCYVALINEEFNEGLKEERLINLRALLPVASNDEIQLLSRGLQLSTWKKQHQYCGQCGQKTDKHTEENAYHCNHCELFFYPRISPCMMCLITKGDYCLLAQHTKHPSGLYTTLAGFVEAGERVEQAVHREVMEEVGLTVNNLSYFASQAWPFPHQLMIGYFAEYVSGDISIDDEEIMNAQWFHYSDLPTVPPLETLSGIMIEAFVEQRRC